MPYKDRETKLAYGRNYHKEHYIPKPRKARTDKEYITKFGERRSKESWEQRALFCSAWHMKNRERRLESAKKRYVDNTEYIKDKYLRCEFGISLEDYKQMLAEQLGVCAICFKPEVAIWKGKVRALAVDHNHTTGKVRALLCMRCNSTLGMLEEDPSLLQSMLRYIEKHKDG